MLLKINFLLLIYHFNLIFESILASRLLSHEDNPYIDITTNMYSVWILVTKRNTSDDGLI
jgi:hypothetical protein